VRAAVLSASVAFVSLSGEAEYAYWMGVCFVRNDWIRAPKSGASAVNGDAAA
jgi:hypothetical protein